MPTTTYTETARAWVTRWDRQQEAFLPQREEQFTALIDVVEEVSGRPDPLVLDLGCGPGSIGVRLLARIPGATVVSLDADPLLIELGRAAYAEVPGLRFADVDLRDPDWAAGLGLERQPDAVLSTTALHWLDPATLESLYGGLTTLLRPGGILVNCDELERDRRTSPVLSRLDRALLRRRKNRGVPQYDVDSWYGWWEEVQAEPAFADAVAERARRGYDGENHSDLSAAFAVHLDALERADFAEVGTIWQHGEVRLLCAVTHDPDSTPQDDEPHTHNHAPARPGATA
ncbi:class I SAM-dependent methyltransferase [Streptomyces xanthochromogenes]|uniref:class I SAM-dependent methyltransferase n=1 Tax=Streptomyces xanthochromogenes TaxID=67384 RepID=UPI003426C1C7